MPPTRPITQNTLFYGDNLTVLREYIPDESIDLIYLDPPFNSNRSYNVLFKDESGQDSEAQITAFEDTWHWGPAAEAAYHELATEGAPQVSTAIAALRQLIGTNQMMAYLVMMAARLVELHRVLKPTGSLYLHCDPTASHYLKVILDTIFGGENFQNEIVWKRTSAHSSANRYGPVHDILLFYSKSAVFIWNQSYLGYADDYVDKRFKRTDPDGRRWKDSDLTGSGIRRGETGQPWRNINITAKGRHWMYPPSQLDQLDAEGRIYWPRGGGMPRLKQFLDDMPGIPAQDIWLDIFPINSQAAERLGYPTQKPLALLERIIAASSNPSDWVLDPFCGCGTAIAAAQSLERRWVGIDITHLSIALQKYRLQDMFGLKPGVDYAVVGEPTSLGGARQLAQDDRFQFQWWALSLVRARPLGGEAGSRQGKKGADRGIDGVITFIDDAKAQPKRLLVQVKSGKVSSKDVRDLRGAVEREEAAIGVFITLEEPTRDMTTEAVSAGYYHSPVWDRKYPRIQILTIADLLAGKGIEMPPSQYGTFRQAARAERPEAEQGRLEL